MKLCVGNSGKQEVVREEEASEELGTGGRGESAKENDEAVLLGLKGVLVRLLASTVPVAAE